VQRVVSKQPVAAVCHSHVLVEELRAQVKHLIGEGGVAEEALVEGDAPWGIAIRVVGHRLRDHLGEADGADLARIGRVADLVKVRQGAVKHLVREQNGSQPLVRGHVLTEGCAVRHHRLPVAGKVDEDERLVLSVMVVLLITPSVIFSVNSCSLSQFSEELWRR